MAQPLSDAEMIVPIDEPEHLRRSGHRGLFVPEVEAEYKRWLVSQVRPVATVVASFAVLLAVSYPFLFTLATPDTKNLPLLFVVEWAVNLPVILLLLFYLRRADPSHAVAAVTVGLVVVAYSGGFVLPCILDDPESGYFLSRMTFYAILAPFVRLPFAHTLVASTLITAGAVGWAFAESSEPTDHVLAGPYASLPIITLILVPSMALVVERTLRARFADEELITRQQARLTEQHQQLRKSQALIRRYAPPMVADRIERGDTTVDSAQRRRVTIFFADVVGFTTLADRLDPEALAEIVNEYLGSVARIVETHGGTLNEFAGDGVMAIFGAPEELEPSEQVLAALAAARELQRSLPEWSQRWYALGIDQALQARIGINTGVVSIGTFGSAVRATYTGIGLQTNIAARIQGECTPGSVLLSKTSWHLISDKVQCQPHGEIEVKGVHFPIAMYEP
ncbi:MAG: adenylate/guanylate cyclase domain-containing protein, partial [Aeromicrobium sp.]